jgi:hypothetical protein
MPMAGFLPPEYGEEEHAMTDRAHWMNDVTSVRQIRDELRLKAHLLRADLRDQYERLEHEFTTIERELRPVGDAVTESAKELDASTRELLKTLRASYARVRDAVKAAV